MQEDLIFHVVSRRKWPKLNKEGVYAPEDFDPEEGIRCALPQTLEEYLNTEYSGRKNIFLLVIDVSRLATNMKKRKEGGYVTLHQPINIDAILDKIQLDSNEKGEFDINVKSFT
ncbi:DUF952 domain-containing protein [Rhodohalobacter sp. 8-1]|uniref:DUF952 domain-containing protein n=1 Tax=Rhodohalobacter sp. 8-1 TaxID=3131972 RepID=UPI0030EC0BF1